MSLPTPLAPIAAFVAPEDQARIEPLYEATDGQRAEHDLRRHPPRPARHPVGHQLRVRHARRRHALVVQRPSVEHRRAARAPRADACRPTSPSATTSATATSATTATAPVRRPPLVDIANALSLSLGRSLDWIHLPVAGATASTSASSRRWRKLSLRPETRALPRPAPPVRRAGRGQGPHRRRAALRARLRRRHRLRLGPPPAARGRRADRPPPHGHHADRAGASGPAAPSPGRRGGTASPTTTGSTTRSTPSVRPTTPSTTTAGTATSTRRWRSSSAPAGRRRGDDRLLGRHGHPRRPPEAADVRHAGRRHHRRQLAEVPAGRAREVPLRSERSACGCCAS